MTDSEPTAEAGRDRADRTAPEEHIETSDGARKASESMEEGTVNGNGAVSGSSTMDRSNGNRNSNSSNNNNNNSNNQKMSDSTSTDDEETGNEPSQQQQRSSSILRAQESSSSRSKPPPRDCPPNTRGQRERLRERGQSDRIKNLANQKAEGNRVSMRDLNFQIPTNADERQHIRDTKGRRSWEYRTLKFLHKSSVQAFLMCMLLLDVILLFIELFLLAQYPPCVIIERDAFSCCPVGDATDLTGDAHRWLAADKSHYCEDPDTVAFKDITAGCDTHKWQTVHNVEKALFGLTIFILTTFFIELNVEMVALRPAIFFRQFFLALDYFIVTVSLGLELGMHFLDQDTLQSLLGLLVIARVWRFVRIGHGIIEVTHEWAQHEYAHLLAYAEDLEDVLKANNIGLPEHRPPACSGGDEVQQQQQQPVDILEEIERQRRRKYRQKHYHSH